jgi:hypothetical protein
MRQGVVAANWLIGGTFLATMGVDRKKRRPMVKTERRKQYAEKLRTNLLARWKHEENERKRKEAQQADLMRWVLNASPANLNRSRSKTT